MHFDIKIRQAVKLNGPIVFGSNFQHINNYLDTFKHIELYDGTLEPALLVKIEDNQVILAKERALKKQWIKNGLPAVAVKLVPFLIPELS